MTELGPEFDIHLHVFYVPPPIVDTLILEDAIGFPQTRFVNSNCCSLVF